MKRDDPFVDFAIDLSPILTYRMCGVLHKPKILLRLLFITLISSRGTSSLTADRISSNSV